VEGVRNENSYRQRKSPAKDGGRTLIANSRSSVVFEHFVHLVYSAVSDQVLNLVAADLFTRPQSIVNLRN